MSRDPRQVSVAYAERIAGKKLDRRRTYALIDGAVCCLSTWTDLCSGCTSDGCRECGYTGRRRVSQWVPIEAKEALGR